MLSSDIVRADRQLMLATEFGARGDGATDDSAALQRLFDAAHAAGKTVFFPAGTYLVSSPLRCWTGVGIVAERGAVLKRNHFLIGNAVSGTYTGDRFVLYLYGNNTVSGLTVDGNHTAATVGQYGVNPHASSMAVDAAGNPYQTNYGDIGISNGPYNYGPLGNTALASPSGQNESGQNQILIDNCEFFRACGSSIKNVETGARGVVIRNCRFHEYYDHAVYFAGYSDISGVNAPIVDIKVQGNTFSYPLQTRGNVCCKIRNHARRVQFVENIFDVPNDGAFAMDTGGTGHGDGPLVNITIRGNAGRAREFCSFADGTGGALASSHDVLVDSNDISVSAYYVFREAVTAGQYPSGSISIKNNKFRNLSREAITNVRLTGNAEGGASWSLTGNEFFGLFSCEIFGSVDLIADGNLAVNPLSPDTMNPAFFASVTAGNSRPAGGRIWVIKNTTLLNYGALFADLSDTTQGETGSHVMNSASIVITGSVVLGHPTRNWLIDVRGGVAGDYVGANTISVAKNLSSGLSPNTTLPGEVYVEIPGLAP